MAGPEWLLASIPPFNRSNGFAEALVGVLSHLVGGGRYRVPDAVPTSFSDTRFVAQYPSRKRTPVFREATCLAAPLCDASASVPVPARFDHP